MVYTSRAYRNCNHSFFVLSMMEIKIMWDYFLLMCVIVPVFSCDFVSCNFKFVQFFVALPWCEWIWITFVPISYAWFVATLKETPCKMFCGLRQYFLSSKHTNNNFFRNWRSVLCILV